MTAKSWTYALVKQTRSALSMSQKLSLPLERHLTVMMSCIEPSTFFFLIKVNPNKLNQIANQSYVVKMDWEELTDNPEFANPFSLNFPSLMQLDSPRWSFNFFGLPLGLL